MYALCLDMIETTSHVSHIVQNENEMTQTVWYIHMHSAHTTLRMARVFIHSPARIHKYMYQIK